MSGNRGPRVHPADGSRADAGRGGGDQGQSRRAQGVSGAIASPSLRGAQRRSNPLPPSFPDGPKDQTSDAQLRIGESRDSGFDASHRPGMTAFVNRAHVPAASARTSLTGPTPAPASDSVD